MATTTIEAGNLFRVDGLVAVITGGGSGLLLLTSLFGLQLTQERYRAYDS